MRLSDRVIDEFFLDIAVVLKLREDVHRDLAFETPILHFKS